MRLSAAGELLMRTLSNVAHHFIDGALQCVSALDEPWAFLVLGHSLFPLCVSHYSSPRPKPCPAYIRGCGEEHVREGALPENYFLSARRPSHRWAATLSPHKTAHSRSPFCAPERLHPDSALHLHRRPQTCSQA